MVVSEHTLTCTVHSSTIVGVMVTVRDGSNVALAQTYTNHYPWVGTNGWTGRTHINYFYEVTLLPDSSYKFETTVYADCIVLTSFFYLTTCCVCT